MLGCFHLHHPNRSTFHYYCAVKWYKVYQMQSKSNNTIIMRGSNALTVEVTPVKSSSQRDEQNEQNLTKPRSYQPHPCHWWSQQKCSLGTKGGEFGYYTSTQFKCVQVWEGKLKWIKNESQLKDNAKWRTMGMAAKQVDWCFCIQCSLYDKNRSQDLFGVVRIKLCVMATSGNITLIMWLS